MARRLVLALLLIGSLTACGGAFVTSTPVFARFTVDGVLREFKSQGLRADRAQELPRDGQWATAPHYREATSFLAGKGNGVAATIFTFDNPGDQGTMADYLKKQYAGHYRLITNENVILVFWSTSGDDTTPYDAALLALH